MGSIVKVAVVAPAAGVADFGYDFYLLAIAKLLHGQYFRLLDFYFHTLIQQRPAAKVIVPVVPVKLVAPMGV